MPYPLLKHQYAKVCFGEHRSKLDSFGIDPHSTGKKCHETATNSQEYFSDIHHRFVQESMNTIKHSWFDRLNYGNVNDLAVRVLLPREMMSKSVTYAFELKISITYHVKG